MEEAAATEAGTRVRRVKGKKLDEHAMQMMTAEIIDESRVHSQSTGSMAVGENPKGCDHSGFLGR
jgi:hypothetical protein